MRRTMQTLALLGLTALLCSVASAQDVNGTLWDQEGTTADGYDGVDGRFEDDETRDSTQNWVHQYGDGSWTGIYKKNGWLPVSASGDSTIDIECDIEMYYTETFENNKIYFHIGNPTTATDADRTAYVTGSFTSNNGQYIGISFANTGKLADDILKDEAGNYTGEVRNAMVLKKDVLGRTPTTVVGGTIAPDAFNTKFSLSWNGGPFQPPANYGVGASGTIQDTLWWLVDGGGKGSYNLQYKVEMLFETTQSDGTYGFDPAIVAAPVL